MNRLTFYTLLLAATLTSNEALAQPCTDGFAEEYPCKRVDQAAFLPLDVFGSLSSNDIWGWTSHETGREYALVGLFDRTAFVDVSSPEHPIFIGYLLTASGGILWRDIKVIGHYAYIVAEAAMHGLQVFDLTRLESVPFAETPVEFDMDAHYTGFGNAHNVVADTANKFVYAVGTSTFAGGLHIVDVSDPVNPEYAGSSEEDGYTHDAQVVTYTGPDADYQGREMCFAANENTITIFDVTDKDDVEMISRTGYDDIGYTHQCWLTEDQRYLIANDELDEMNFAINTRTIIFDMLDLDNPEVVGYVDLGTESVDHNLYVKDGLLYLSNYTSGLRIHSLKDVGEGVLPAVAHFDVYPDNDSRLFQGSWSNYPWFESGTVVTTNMYSGFHVLEPRLFALRDEVVEVCGANTASLLFDVNVPLDGEVQYAVEYPGGSGPEFFLESTSSNGAPFTNAILFIDLSSFTGQYIHGEVVISYDETERRLPFAIVVSEEGNPAEAPVLAAPVNGVVLESQLVAFEWTDAAHGYAVLEVSPNPDFEPIVYSKPIYGANGSFVAEMPFSETVYHWRLSKPDGCGQEPSVSETGEFEIGLISSATAGGTGAVQALGLFPNPAGDWIMLKAPAGVDVVNVYDLSGRKVDQWQVTGNTTAGRNDISRLAPGIYIARDVSGSHHGRFVVR